MGEQIVTIPARQKPPQQRDAAGRTPLGYNPPPSERWQSG